jgi:2-C-methyl-D-erythritol 4-phosphate cytidylyltransferase
MQVFAILPAAGLGTRMAGPQPKQFLELDGVPILIHSLRAFAAVARVTAIYVAVRKTEMERVQAQIAEHGFADSPWPTRWRLCRRETTTLCWCTTRCDR